jgi:hypothetical protein
MAAVHTIEVLDNLQFAHDNTADIYTVHADGFAGEAIESRLIEVNAEKILGLRVIVNNNYGASGSTICAKIRATGLTGLVALSKFQDQQPLEWSSVALGAALSSTEIDLSAVRSLALHLFCAIVGTTAHLGTEFRVQVRNEATVNEWTDLSGCSPLIMCSGKTAFKTDVLSTAAAGQKVIPVNDPTAGNLNHLMKNIFILDATVANCEIAFQTACGADA